MSYKNETNISTDGENNKRNMNGKCDLLKADIKANLT